ncbi:serendipity locus protein H-1-like [Pseudomyrmex gracilis]|uniref:serendipity locus protein H-1-like n=1 Tax=Pseudomyrmex gracilis TaxID=219809 RepID=UPI000994B474|nr:serendipity locus protein H-1-like [Pseudomyrmex gracilis]
MTSTSTDMMDEPTSNDRQYQCIMCDAVCENEISMIQHYYNCHTKTTYACNKCEYTSYFLQCLKKHVTKMHLYIGNYCVICDKDLYSQYEYKCHENVHKCMTSNMFRCDICKSKTKYLTFGHLIDHHKQKHFK